MAFRPLALAGPAQAAPENVAIFTLQSPTLTPNPSIASPGGKGEPTALCGRVLEVDEFTVSRQLSKRPLTALCGRVFKGMAFTVLRQPSK